jgi:hypothetical protein
LLLLLLFFAVNSIRENIIVQQRKQMSDDGHLYHTRTRATGQLWIGPMQMVGYDNRVKSVTLNEIEFKNSTEADRFLEQQRKKYADNKVLTKSNRLRFLGRADDD